MPNRLYVAGPVIDHGAMPDVYRTIADWGEARAWEVRLPLRHPDTERMTPETFTKWVGNEIHESDAVLAFVVGGDQSVPSEITMAASDSKPQVLVAQEPNRVPRLLEGQRGVVAVVPAEDLRRALGALEEVLDEPLGMA
jgi:hypothetical protein